MSTDDTHDEDALAARLRGGLYRELQDVRSRPGDLDAVLDRAHAAHRRGAAPWVLSAAAVAVVALAVPVTAQLVRDDPPADRLAAPASTVPSPVLPSPALPGPVPPSPLPPAPSAGPSPTLTPPPPSPATPRPAPPAPPRTSPSTCPDAAPPGPAGPVQADLEGDGRPDTIGFADGALVVRFSRGGSSTTPFATASPYASVLVVEADGVADDELLVLTRGPVGDEGDVGANATLYDLSGCALSPVLNVQGDPYVFEVGVAGAGTVRSGVECDGDVLLGVVGTSETPARWQVSRTPVTVRDGVAVNGEPRRTALTADDPGVAQLSEAACGDAPVQSLG
jgi:hypothetical protein